VLENWAQSSASYEKKIKETYVKTLRYLNEYSQIIFSQNSLCKSAAVIQNKLLEHVKNPKTFF